MQRLLVAGLLSIIVTGLGAQSGPLPPAAVPPVLVSATRLREDGIAVTRDVTVLDSAEIARRAATSIAELLAGVTGVDARTRGPFGTQVDLEIDGATYSQVLVLIDGMRVNDPQTGHHTLNLPLAPEDLQRVEVLHGPASSVHGTDAVGGVVNLVPRHDARPRVDIAARWGERLDDGSVGVGTDAGLRLGVGNASRGLTLSLTKRRTDGYRDGTDADEERLFVRGQLPLAGGRLALQGGWQDKAFGARDFYAPFPSREWTTVHLFGATFERTLGATATTSRVYLRRHRDRFVLIESDPAVYENRHLNWLSGGVLQLRRAVAGGEIVAGGEWTQERIDSSNLGDHERRRAGLFTELGTRREAWHLNAGIRADYYQDSGWVVAPTLSLGRRIGALSRWYATVGRSYRAPSFTELYYTDPNNVGNADLAAETAWQYETGASTVIGAARLRGALFLRRERNLVDYIRATGTPPWVARNLGAMETRGLRLRWAQRWRLLRAEGGYTYIGKAQTLDPGLESKYVFTQPRHQVDGRLHHAVGHSVDASWQVMARQRLAPLQDDLRVDLVLRRPLAAGAVRLRIANLLNAQYEEVLGVPLPGRWFSLETRVDL